jgi:hypothetical protein
MSGYNLSRTYQLKENLLTMRLIFPLDFSYVGFLTVFIGLSAYLRIFLNNVGRLTFIISYEGIDCVEYYLLIKVFKYYMRI